MGRVSRPPGARTLTASLRVIRRGSDEERAALVVARATADDLADAATLGAERGAARLNRRRLLRAFAAEHLGAHPDRIEMGRDAEGRPFIASPQSLHTSVAGRGEWTALALSAHPVGVDIETRPAQAPLPLDHFPDAERRAIGALPDPARNLAFLRPWTAREAFAKASGWPLDRVLSGVMVEGEGDRLRLIHNGDALAIAAITVSDAYVLAVVELVPKA